MFDTYRIESGPNYPQTINKTVHEHKAPTDESVRLLNEMQEKALENATISLIPGNNTITGVSIQKVTSTNYLGQSKIVVAFKLNNKEIVCTIPISNFGYLSPQETFQKLVEELSKSIINEIINDNLEPFIKVITRSSP